MYIVDTDVLSSLAKRNRQSGAAKWIAKQRTTNLFLSVVTIGEIERGIALQRNRNPQFAAALAAWLDQILASYGDRILPFDLPAARRWGQLSATLGHGGADLQIAATALENGLAVVTGNSQHFAPTGVQVIDPFRP